jgi:hypothetical protein
MCFIALLSPWNFSNQEQAHATPLMWTLNVRMVGWMRPDERQVGQNSGYGIADGCSKVLELRRTDA